MPATSMRDLLVVTMWFCETKSSRFVGRYFSTKGKKSRDVGAAVAAAAETPPGAASKPWLSTSMAAAIDNNNKIEIDAGIVTLRQQLGHERRQAHSK